MDSSSEKADKQFHGQKFEEAARLYQDILTNEPGHLRALTGLGLSMLKLQKPAEAIHYLSRAITISPANAQLFSERAVAFFLNNQLAKALEDFDVAQSLEPHNPYRYSSRAFVKNTMGDTPGAIADYEKAIALDPEDAISLNNLGLIQEKLGYQEQAKRNFSMADTLEGRALENPGPDQSKVEKEQEPDSNKPAQKRKISLKDYSVVLKSVLTSKEGFKEFISFLSGKKK